MHGIPGLGVASEQPDQPMTDWCKSWKDAVAEPGKPLTRATIERIAAKLSRNGLAPGTPLYVPRARHGCEPGPCAACSADYACPVEHLGD